MHRTIVKSCLFILALLLISAPAWESTSAGIRPSALTSELIADAGTALSDWFATDRMLARSNHGNRGNHGNQGNHDNNGGNGGDNGDCEPDPDPVNDDPEDINGHAHGWANGHQDQQMGAPQNRD